MLHVDGAARGNPGPAGIGIVVTDGRGAVVRELAEYLGPATNNVAEYHALIRALDLAADLGATEVQIRSDSQLLVRQVQGAYRVRNPVLLQFHGEARRRLEAFRAWSITHIPRRQNARADALANRAIDQALGAARGHG